MHSVHFGVLCASKLGGVWGHANLQIFGKEQLLRCNVLQSGHVFKEDFHVYFGVKFSEKYSLKVHLDFLLQI